MIKGTSNRNNFLFRDGVKFAKIPHPYKAMLAICSDLDETPCLDVYLEIMKFLNTDKQTSMGKGVSLEVGNTIYFEMPGDQFSYWNTDDRGRIIIDRLIESGHIDCIHSFGDHATSGIGIDRALKELSKLSRRISVWIDHAQAKTNLGSDIMHGEGDIKTSEIYHSDKTIEYGVKYVWLGRVTSVIGQNAKHSFSHLFNADELKKSLVTILKESIKILMGKMKNRKYMLHANNDLMAEKTLRDGSRVKEFIRCNPHWGGVSYGDDSIGIASVLTRNVLDELVRKNAVSIIYTHLGKIRDKNIPFGKEAVNAFRKLKEYEKKSEILVTTTSRVLAYNNMLQSIRFEKKLDKDQINIVWDGNMQDLNGLTIYIDDHMDNVQVTINGEVNEQIKFINAMNGQKNVLKNGWQRIGLPSLDIS